MTNKPLTAQDIEEAGENLIKNYGTLDASQAEGQKEAVELSKAEQRQKEKAEKKAKEYWNGMITRREAYEMVQMAVKPYQDIPDLIRTMYTQNMTLTNLLVDKGLTTMEDLNERSKTVLAEILSPPEEAQEENTEE